MDNYNFEEFKSTGTRFNMGISLGKAERFYLGSAFFQKYNIGLMAGVKLLYDKQKNAIGFKFLGIAEDGMVGIKKLHDQSAYINAKAFLGIYDIDASKFGGKYTPKEVLDNIGGQIFVIELKENQKEV